MSKKRVDKGPGDTGKAPKSEKGTGKRGMPPFVPTKEDRQRVRNFAKSGIKTEKMVLAIINPRTDKPIDEDTLFKYFRREIDEAVIAYGDVGGTLYEKAMGDGPQAVAAAIWITKCRMGWRGEEKIDVNELAQALVAADQVREFREAMSRMDNSVMGLAGSAGADRVAGVNANGSSNGQVNGNGKG